MSIWRKGITSNFVLLLLVVSLLSLADNRQYHRPTRTLTGDDWGKMTAGEKFYFVHGYMFGMSEGYQEACLNVYAMIGNPSLAEEDNLGYRCMAQRRSWRWSREHYVDRITAFYEQYPQHNQQQVVGLIHVLSGEEGKTIEQINEMLRESKF